MARTRLYPPSVDPGFPTLPPRPEGWVRTTFRELVEPVERPVRLDPGGTYKLVNAKRARGGIVLRGLATGREILTKTQFEVKAGDFLMSRRQIIHGACGVVPEDLDGAIVSNEYSVLRPKSGLLLEFLDDYSHTPYFQRTCFHSSHGVDVEKMVFKLDRWLAWPVDVPPISEQRKIASMLSTIDGALGASQAVIDRTDETKKAMLGEYLRYGLSRNRSSSGCPAGWKRSSLRAVAQIVGGFAFPRDLQGGDSGQFPFIKVSDMNLPGNERFVSRAVNSVDTQLVGRMGWKIYPPNTVIFPKVGAALLTNKRRLLGKPALFDNNVMGLIAEAVDARFLFYFLQTIDFATLVQPGALPSISGAIVGDIEVPIPPHDEAMTIAGALTLLDERLDAERTHLVELKRLKGAVATVLLSGQVRVSPGREVA